MTSKGLIVASLIVLVSATARANNSEPADASPALRFENTITTIRSAYDGLQLVVTSTDGATTSDVTRDIRWEVHPEGIVEISPGGFATPKANGTATISARAGHLSADLQITVSVPESEVPRFDRHLMPMLAKHACNTCHGKPGGQNGFQISLFGFDPAADHRSIVLGGRGRRITPAVPGESLILRKATAKIPHGGGERFSIGSLSHETWADWIAGGAPGLPTDYVKASSVSVMPQQRRLSGAVEQQLCVIATYPDGSRRDVTHLAQFQADATQLATVDAAGRVTTDGRSGQFAIVVKFDGQVDTFRGTSPFSDTPAEQPEPLNFIDQVVFEQWQRLGLQPAESCDDATFLRRVTLDLAGRLPTLRELEDFEGSESTNRRNEVVERLLDSDDYAAYFANKWLHLLRNRRIFAQQRRSSFSFHHWIKESFRTNQPYDEFVGDIVAASGDMSEHPPATWYRELKDPTAMVENMSQLFLGVRITCAKCHHHPFEKWSQDDYYSLAAFFSTVNRKYSITGSFRDFEARIYHKYGEAKYKQPESGQWLKPAVLGGEPLEIDPDDDPRKSLVQWMTADDNPFFATVLVNRYWKHFFGRGIVDPEDDLRDSNPPINPELLDALRNHFVESGFDRKAIVRAIVSSKTYQLSSDGSEDNLADVQNFSRYYPQRLDAEVIYDSIDQMLGTETKFASLPTRFRAVELPDSGSDNEFLELFGKPKAESSCECERSQDGDLRQSLMMLTSSDILAKLGQSSARPARFAKEKDHRSNIVDLYRIAYGRPPTDEELATALDHVSQHDQPAKAYQDLCWVIINTKEFLYNH